MTPARVLCEHCLLMSACYKRLSTADEAQGQRDHLALVSNTLQASMIDLLQRQVNRVLYGNKGRGHVCKVPRTHRTAMVASKPRTLLAGFVPPLCFSSSCWAPEWSRPRNALRWLQRVSHACNTWLFNPRMAGRGVCRKLQPSIPSKASYGLAVPKKRANTAAGVTLGSKW